ncbi:hypothetical protein [Pseudovibrio axinellae]|uniref:hypothetical protein n=1 Tax=Pseudovibrio axinellae TaxID=989403 RepID=UPI00111408C7|nr:hypothetical protein [Pseudovibrio axinellae]
MLISVSLCTVAFCSFAPGFDDNLFWVGGLCFILSSVPFADFWGGAGKVGWWCAGRGALGAFALAGLFFWSFETLNSMDTAAFQFVNPFAILVMFYLAGLTVVFVYSPAFLVAFWITQKVSVYVGRRWPYWGSISPNIKKPRRGGRGF